MTRTTNKADSRGLMKPTTHDDLSGVAGGSHDSRDLDRDRKDLRSEDLVAAVGGCGSREQRRRNLTSDELSDVVAGASRRTRSGGGEV